jgi:aryl-alcohol dehydrogenase-like predicted oxidoreductase
LDYHSLGQTGLNVSAVALGTASLGMGYGIQAPGEGDRLAEEVVIRLLREATDAGINLFDTAPAYGKSERLLGQALGQCSDCYFATKVPIPKERHSSQIRRAIHNSLENSLHALQRDVLDIVQIHNATVDVITHGEITDVLLGAQQEGKIRFLGATVYTEAEALAVIEAGHFNVLQVAYNVLDQRMTQRVFPAAMETGIGVMVRSALLKGALTARSQWLPSQLAALQQAAERARDILAGSWQFLPQMALRFCLSARQVATVLVGVRTTEELRQVLIAVEDGPLSEESLARTADLALADERLLNPSYWPIS